MKRFRSRVESLRRIREQTEQLLKLHAATRRAQRDQAERELHELRAELSRVETLGTQELLAGRTALIQSITSATARLELAGHEATQRRQLAEQNLTAAIQAVARARQDLEIVDSHIERERQEHRRQNLNEEKNQRQENTAQRFARRTSAEQQEVRP